MCLCCRRSGDDDRKDDISESGGRSEKKACSGNCIGFTAAVFLVLFIAGLAVTLYYLWAIALPYVEEQDWDDQLSGEIVEAKLDMNEWYSCDADRTAGHSDKSRYPCLKITMRGKDSTVENKFYLTRRDWDDDKNDCFYNPENSCHNSEDVNVAIMEAYEKIYSPGSTVSFYYTNEDDDPGVALAYNDRWDESDVVMRLVPAAIVALISLLVLIFLCAWSCCCR